MTLYVGAIHKDPDSDYGISFPDFPGCISAGATVADAIEMGREALALYCSDLLELGQMPSPTPPEAVAGNPDYADAVLVLVEAPARPPRAKRVNVTLPDDLLARIDDQAQREGFSRSGWLAHVSRKALAEDAA